jgi:putative transposase
MPRDFHDEVLMFSLDPRHHITIRGAELRFAWLTNGVATFHAAEDPRRKVAYEIAELNRLNRAGEITVIPDGLVPEHLRPGPVHDDRDVFIAGLAPAQRVRVAWRYGMVRGFADLKAAGVVDGTDESIAGNMDATRAAAEPYVQEELPDPEYSLKLRNWEEGRGRKPRTPRESRRPGACSPRALRNWVSLYRKGGKEALIDRCAKQGSVSSPFNAEEIALLGEVVRAEYMTLQRKPVVRVVEDVKLAFAEANACREAEGLPALKVPGRDAVRGFLKRLDAFAVLVARHGAEQAMQTMRPAKGGVEVTRPLERVEMDEQKIDLIAILALSGLVALFSKEELEMLGLLDPSMRWWLVLAIDCRTRCILGMTLTSNPRTSAALKCLRMVVSDKGQFADKVGALAPWSIYGTPETLVTDNGAAFKAWLFTSACTDLGIHALQAIGGAPGMRGVGERVFGTLSSGLMSRLAGRTFFNVIEREDHDSGKRACLTVEDVTVALVRWAVDIYHNTPHEGLGGRTPLQQWEADLRAGNVPLHSAPSARRKHIALGVSLERVLQKDGIRVMNVRYISAELAGFFLEHGKRTLEVRWNEEDLGSLEVLFDGAWRTVPAALDAFKGVHASTWLRSRRSLRASDPKRKAWEEDVIGATIRDIEAMNAHAKAAFHILDHAWTEKRLKEVEAEALMTFDVVPTRAKTPEASDGRGQVILPVNTADHGSETPRIAADRHSLPVGQAGDGDKGGTPGATRATGGTPAGTTDAGTDDTTGGGRPGGNSDGDGWDFPD